MELQALLLSILLLSILTGSESKSLDQSFTCATECYTGTEVGFRSNKEYSYLYQAEIESSFHTDSAADQKSTLSIQANVKIQAKSSCDILLLVEDIVSIDGAAPLSAKEIEWQSAITANPLPFSWQNGRVDHLCPSTDDPIWVLNFKRGILSALQVSSMKSESAVKELDVSGDCEANYIVEPGRRRTEITKIKDYSKCANRDRHLMFSYFTPYQSQSPRQNFIHSYQNCKQTLRGTNIETVDCTEEHTFRPFSTEESGARTKITQKVSLLEQRLIRSLARNVDVPRRQTTLQFEEEPEEVLANQEIALQAANDLMTDICATMDTENYDIVGKQFISLVFSLRHLDSESLSTVYSHLDTCTEWRSSLKEMFVDALPFCGTEGCVEFTTNLIMNDGVKKNVAQRWLAGFSFIQTPTPKMVSSLMDIVEARKLSEISMLAAGTMINRICSQSKTNCLNDNNIRTSLEILEQHLGANCRTSNAEANKMILMALRSIGNAGRSTSMSTLARCINENDNDMEIRVAAVQAYRRMPCSEDRSVLLQTLFNMKEDSELRIASYINLMQCPTSDLVTGIKSLLEEEQNMQVGSYIWSHLNEMMESQDPLKGFIQMILSGESFKEFNLDPRKYSRFAEATIFSEKLNAGGTAEGSLIWSPKSFIPRSASVNLTIDFFGQAVNLFEFGGRLQGFEKYLQSYLEPEAFEKRQSRSDVPDSLPSNLKRNPRRSESKVSKGDELRGSWFFRVFGNEMSYQNSDMFAAENEGRPRNILTDFATKFMSEEGFNYHDDSLLLNSVHTLPTGVGLPLHMAFNGSTTIDVHAIGGMDMQGMFSNSPEFLVQGKLVPRASVVITGSMIVDAHVKKAGIATESKVVTHATMDGFAKVFDGGNSFKFEVNTPHSKNVAFEFKHKLLKVDDDQLLDLETYERNPAMNELSQCSDELLGQKFCYNKRYVKDRFSNGAPANPVFPMDGPLEISAYLLKTDSSITKYTMIGKQKSSYETPEDYIPSNFVVSFKFDTPESTVDRLTSIDFSYNLPAKRFSARGIRGGDIYAVQGSISTDTPQKTMHLSADWNGQRYLFNANYEMATVDQGTKWMTDATLTMPEKTVTAEGAIALSPGKVLQIELDVNNILTEPIVFKLELQDKTQKNRNKLSYSGAGKISVQPLINTGFNFDMILRPKLDQLLVDVQYNIGGRATESILLHHKRTNLGSKSVTDWKIDHSLTSTQLPSINHMIDVSYKSSEGSVKTDAEIHYGSSIEEPNNPYKLEFSQEFQDQSTESSTDWRGSYMLNVPYMEIFHSISLEYLNNANELDTKFIGHCSSSSPNIFHIMWKNNQPESELLDRNIEIEFPTPYGRMLFKDDTKETPANVYTSRSELSLGEASDLSFSRYAQITNLPNLKSIALTVEKADGSRVVEISSTNKMESSEYSSENFIHVAGFESRGLNIFHQYIASEGYPTKIEYLKSSVVQIGAEAMFTISDTEKHVTLSIQQNQVMQRKITFKSGYVYPGGNFFKTYITLQENDSDLLNSEIKYEKDTSKPSAGSFSVIFNEYLSEETTVSKNVVTIDTSDALSFSLEHTQNDKNVLFSVELNEEQTSVSGVLQHNFCEYVNDATYMIQLDDDSLVAKLMTGRTQARLTFRKSSKEIKARFTNNIMDLNELDVPSSALVSFKRTSDDQVKAVSLTMQVGEKSMKTQTSYSDQTGGDILNVVLQYSVQNNLIAQIPESMSSEFQIMIGEQNSMLKHEFNGQVTQLSAQYTLPGSASVSFTNSLSQLEELNVPSSLSLEYAFESVGQLQLKFLFENQELSATGTYASSNLQIDILNQVFSSMPGKLNFEFTGDLTSERRTLSASMILDDKKYDAEWEHFYHFEERIGLSKFSFIPITGTADMTLDVKENLAPIFHYKSTIELREDFISTYYRMSQNVFEEFPTIMSEQRKLTITENKYAYMFNKQVNEISEQFDVTLDITADASFQLEMLIKSDIPELPSRTILHYGIGSQENERTITLNAYTQSGLKTASLSLDLPTTNENLLSLSGMHEFEELEVYVPLTMNANLKWKTTGTILGGAFSYKWGEEQGNAGIHWNTESNQLGCQVHIPGYLSVDMTYSFSYNIDGTSFQLDSKLSVNDEVYQLHFDSAYSIGEELSIAEYFKQGKLTCNGRIQLGDKVASSNSLVQLTEDFILISTNNMQNISSDIPPSFNFEKKFSWALHSGEFKVQIGGVNGETPIEISASVQHDESNMISLEINHNQDAWAETIAKNFIIRGERRSDDNTHTVVFSLSEDGVKKSITISSSIALLQNAIEFDVNAAHDFQVLQLEFELPTIMSLSVGGSIVENSAKASFKTVYGDMTITYGFNFMKKEDGSITVENIASQNVLPDYPQNAYLNFNFLQSDVRVGSQLKCELDGQDYFDISVEITNTKSETIVNMNTKFDQFEPASFMLKWTGKESGFGIWDISHDITSLSYIPRNLKLKLESNEDMSLTGVALETDEYTRRITLQRSTGGSIFSMRLQHDFEFPNSDFEFAKVIMLEVVSSPTKSITLKLDEKLITIEKTEDGIRYEQNFLEYIPGSIVLSYRFELETARKIIDLKCNVDEHVYEVFFMYNLNTGNTRSALQFESKIRLDQKSLIFGTVLESSPGQYEFRGNYTQSIIDELPPSWEWDSTVRMAENTGSLKITVSAPEQPLQLFVQYDKVSDARYEIEVTHNQQAIAEYIPTQFGSTVTYSLSETQGGFEVTMRMNDLSQSFSLSFSHINEESLDFTLKVSHDFDILVSELMIPKICEFSISGTVDNIDVSVSYGTNSDKKYVKIHADYENSQLHANLDQNIFEEMTPVNGRRSATSYPKKTTLLVGVNKEEGYIMKMTSKDGKKRRYFILEYQPTMDGMIQGWNIQMNHNLNKMLPIHLPTNVELSLQVSETSIYASIGYNKNNYDCKLWHDSGSVAGLKLTHTDNDLSTHGIPTTIEWTGSVDENDLSVSTRVTVNEIIATAGMGLQRGENMVAILMNCTSNARPVPLSLSGEIKATKQDTSISISLSGTQDGLDEFMPNNFAMTLDTGVNADSSRASFNFAHNIPLLKDSFEIPRNIEIVLGGEIDVTRKTLAGSIKAEVDNLFFSHTTLEATLSETGVKFGGMRTRNLWSTSNSEQLKYVGNLDIRSYRNWNYTYTEYNSNNVLELQEEVYLQTTSSENHCSWDVVTKIKSLNDLGLPSQTTGSVTFDEQSISFDTSISTVDGKILIKLVKTEEETGRAVKFSITHGDQQINLTYGDSSLTLSNNMQGPLAQYIPQNIVVTAREEITTVIVNSAMLNFVTNIHSNRFDMDFSITNIGTILRSSGSYVTHPSYQVLGELQIPMLNINCAFTSDIQFFMPGNGKSVVTFLFTDRNTNQKLTVSAHGYLMNRNILSLDLALSVNSEIEIIPVNFNFTFVSHNELSSHKFEGHVGDYSVVLTTTARSFLFKASLPHTFRINQVLLSGNCEGDLGQNLNSDIQLQWNNNMPIQLKTSKTIQSDSHEINVVFRQPFTEFKSLEADYSFRKQNGEYRIELEGRKDDENFSILATYSESNQRSMSTHDLVVDLQHPFNLGNIPGRFLTSGTISYSDTMYDSKWKISSEETDPIILQKHFELGSDGLSTTLVWKQPFNEFPLRDLTADLTLNMGASSIEVTGNLRYNDQPNMLLEISLVDTSSTDTVSGRMTITQPFTGLGFTQVSTSYSLQKTDNEYHLSVSAQKDEETLAVESTYSADLNSVTKIHSLKVDIQHPFNHPNIPKHFVTTGVIKYNSNMYDSNWKIESGETEPVIIVKHVERNGDTSRLSVVFKQPSNEYPVTDFESEIELRKTSDNIHFVGSMKYNNEPDLHADYKWESTDLGNSVNSSLSFSVGKDTYKSDWFYTLKAGTTSGQKLTIVYNNYLPSNTKLFSISLPTSIHYREDIFWRDNNLHAQIRFGNDLMSSPVQLDFLYVLQNGNQLLDSSLSVIVDPEHTEEKHVDIQFVIDTIEGVTLSVRLPSAGIDKSINVRYIKRDNVAIVKYIVAGSEPITIRIDLQNVIPRLTTLWNSMNIRDAIPKVSFIGKAERRADLYDVYAGMMIRDTPYTIHFVTGVGVQRVYFQVVTKKNFEQVDELLRIEGFLTNPDNIQLQITADKQLSAFLRMVLTSCHTEQKEKMDMIFNKILNALESMKGIVSGSENVQRRADETIDEWMKFVSDLQQLIDQLMTNIRTDVISSMMKYEDSTEASVRRLIAVISSAVQKLKDIVHKPLQQLKEDYLNVVATEILNIIQPVLKPVTRLLNQVHAGQLFLELLQEGITKFIYLMDRNVEAVLNAAKKPVAELVYLSDNQVTINIPLSFRVVDLVSLPTMADVATWIAQSSLAKEIDERMKLLYKITEYYYQYRSILNMPLDEILPPFKGHAEMTGFRHFHTFDGKRFDYTSSCGSTHIIAHDFRNNEFTILVTYGDIPAVTIMSVDSTGRQQTVILNSDYTVTEADGRSTPLPMEYGDVTVLRTGDLITAKTALGLTVACNFKTELCTFDVSPFYFGGLDGMTGTFNHEPNDDMDESTDSGEFALSWMTPGECVPENQIEECGKTSNHVCDQLFKDPRSQFHSCFPVEDPEPFRKMCMQDTCQNNQMSNTCGAVASYARRCQLRGVELTLPDACAKCVSVTGDTFTNSQQVSVAGADVVFVVEKSGCLRIKRKEYKRLLNNLHTALNGTMASGNMKYAVVGFGGPRGLAEPHSITLNDDIFMQTNRRLSSDKEREIISAFKRGEKTNVESDVLQALHYASQLPFRAGASRTIILLTCSDCTAPSTVKMNVVKSVMRQQGIILHHLRQKNIQSGGNVKKVYGFNQREVFAKSSNSDITRADLRISGDDQCLPLVDLTSGSVWNSNSLNRDSLDYIVNEVTLGVNSVSRQNCVCNVGKINAPTAICSEA